MITAACLAQCATSFGVRYRERTQQYKALRERDLQLGESEEKFRRVFETSSDAIVITRTIDGHIIDVNREFVDRTGYSREEVMGRRPSELDLWDDREQAKLLSDEIKAAGFARNVEGHFRMRSGEPVTALISSVRAMINGQECVISAVRDVTELRKAHEALVAAREVALAASEAKSQFLSCMSHEIRTPLNVILGSADLLTDTQLGPEQRHYVDRVINNGSNLLELLNSILDLTRVESGQLSLEQAPFNVAELTERVADTLAIRTRETQVELVARFAPDLPVTLLGDPLRLQPGADQPRRQCDQVHRARRGRRRDRARHAKPRSRRAALFRKRHRHRHRARKTHLDLFALRPGRLLDHAQVWRQRPGTRDRRAPGALDGRPGMG